MTDAIKAQVAADRLRMESRPLGETIPGLMFDAAADAPDEIAIAVLDETLTLTYRATADWVRKLATELQARGVTSGDVVGVMLRNGPEFPIAWMAITALGAVMIPVNTSYTTREVRFVLSKGGASHLIIEEGLRDELDDGEPLLDGTLLSIALATADTLLFEGLVASDAVADPDFTPVATQFDLSNIQFTSGSTGMPKGCRQTHRFWLEVALFVAEAYQPIHKRILVNQSLFYMDPQFMFLAAVRNRGTAFIARRQSASRFFDWVADNGIEFMFLPEFVYKQEGWRGKDLSKVRRAMVFGWGRENHVEAEDALGFPLREGFGMTEIGIAAYLPENAREMLGSRSCGLPAPYRELKVMRSLEEQADPGESGELWVRGPGVITAYHDNPEANENSFQDGWFRTGDLAVQDAEGFYYYVGRLKDMIRRSGENIAAQEIEAVLRTAPGIFEASVVPVKDLARGEEVKAFVTCSPGVDLRSDQAALEAVYKTCAANLAPFKVPRFIEQIDVFPRTGSNKIAKKELVSSRMSVVSEHYDRTAREWVQQF